MEWPSAIAESILFASGSYIDTVELVATDREQYWPATDCAIFHIYLLFNAAVDKDGNHLAAVGTLQTELF